MPDASGYAVGGVLLQDHNDGTGFHPISFVSRQMTDAELKYTTHQQELMAVFHCFKQWRHLLLGRTVTVHTDHAPLKHYSTQPLMSGRFARWLDFFSQFDMNFIPISGSANVADFLSRRPDMQEKFLDSQSALRKTAIDDSKLFASLCNDIALYSDVSFMSFISAMLHDSISDFVTTSATLGFILDNDIIVEDHNSLWGDVTPSFLFDLSTEDSNLVFNTDQILPDVDFVRSLTDGYKSDDLAMHVLDPTKYHNPLMTANYRVVDNLIYRNNEGTLVLYVPATSVIHSDDVTEVTLRNELLRNCHDVPTVGHLGRDRTMERLSRNFYWPRMASDVADYVRSCSVCQRNKPRRHRPYGTAVSLEIPYDRWTDIAIDFVPDLPVTVNGYNCILVVLDLLSKRGRFIKCKTSITAVETARLFFNHIFKHHGLPKKIISDRDPRFTSNFWTHLFKILQSKLAMSTPFHPNTDPVERLNQTMEIMLRCYTNDHASNWDEYLAAAEFAYNNAKSASTDYTPFQLDTGRNPCTPVSILNPSTFISSSHPASAEFLHDWNCHVENARVNIIAAQKYSQQNRSTKLKSQRFNPGEMVWISSAHTNYPGKLPKPKFADLFLGPVEVISVTPNGLAYKLKLPDHIKCHNVQPINRLEPYITSTSFEHPNVPADQPTYYSDGSKEYTVESILDRRFIRRGRGGRVEYLIKYEGMGAIENEWKHVKDLKHCTHAISDFHELVNSGKFVSSYRQS